jgi:hypothetical protein
MHPNIAFHRQFMLDPGQWPENSFWSKKIYLKRGEFPQDLAQLVYLDGRWGFCEESAPFQADLSTAKWGGPELVDEVINAGWIVD